MPGNVPSSKAVGAAGGGTARPKRRPELADLSAAARRHRHDSHRPDSAIGSSYIEITQTRPVSIVAIEPRWICQIVHEYAFRQRPLFGNAGRLNGARDARFGQVPEAM
jgi:hypothetical protein